MFLRHFLWAFRIARLMLFVVVCDRVVTERASKLFDNFLPKKKRWAQEKVDNNKILRWLFEQERKCKQRWEAVNRANSCDIFFSLKWVNRWEEHTNNFNETTTICWLCQTRASLMRSERFSRLLVCLWLPHFYTRNNWWKEMKILLNRHCDLF